MKHIFRAVTLFLVCGSFSGAQEPLKPADVDVAGLFDVARAHSARTQSARFTFTQTTSMMGQTMKGEAEGILKSPGKTRVVIRMSMPMGEIATSVISDGETMWQTVKMPMGLQVVNYDLATMDASAAAQVSGLGPWGTVDADRIEELKNQVMLQFDLHIGGKDEVSGAPVYVVDAKPRSGAQTGPLPIDRMQFRVGAVDGFIRTMDVYDKAGNALVSLSIQDLAFDVEAADSLFAYTPPPGVPVGDGNALMKTMQDALAQHAGLLQKEAPEFALKSLDGNEVSLASLRGKVVLIDFWASWCRPCVEALPHIQKLNDEFQEKGLAVLGINAEPVEVARKFLQDNGYSFTTLIDEGKTAWALYKIQGIPTTLVIGKEGIVKSYTVGYRTEQDIRAVLARAGVE